MEQVQDIEGNAINAKAKQGRRWGTREGKEALVVLTCGSQEGFCETLHILLFREKHRLNDSKNVSQQMQEEVKAWRQKRQSSVAEIRGTVGGSGWPGGCKGAARLSHQQDQYDLGCLVSDTSIICEVQREAPPANSAYQTKWSHCTLPVLSGRLGQYIHHLPLVQVHGGELPKQTNHNADSARIEDKYNTCL